MDMTCMYCGGGHWSLACPASDKAVSEAVNKMVAKMAEEIDKAIMNPGVDPMTPREDVRDAVLGDDALKELANKLNDLAMMERLSDPSIPVYIKATGYAQRGQLLALAQEENDFTERCTMLICHTDDEGKLMEILKAICVTLSPGLPRIGRRPK